MDAVKLHSVIISYNRLELTQRTIASYLETVTVPHTLWVVDNASTDGTREWLMHEYHYGLSLLDENRYPGFACNQGWSMAPPSATHLHRSDNDFVFLPGWCDEVKRKFRSKTLGQLGLRTDEEEEFNANNVGGNCVIRRELWDAGLRYDETPWPEISIKGYTEDSFFSPAVKAMGWKWSRVNKPCIQPTASGDWSDPYYQDSYFTKRGIQPRENDPTKPENWTEIRKELRRQKSELS